MDMANARLDRDIPCVQCKYNLRGLPDDGVCPEYGQRIALTIAQSRKTSRSKFFYTKRVPVFFIGLYVLFNVVGILVGGKAGGWIASLPIFPIAYVLQFLGIGVSSTGVFSDTALLTMHFCGGPIFWIGIGALLGLAFDRTNQRFNQ